MEPLIIILFAVVVFIVIATVSANNKSNTTVSDPKSAQKTNVRKEQEILNACIKAGDSFDDAYRKSYVTMIEMGFTPRLLKDSYTTGYEGRWYAYGAKDSYWVQQRIKIIHRMHELNDEPIPEGDKLDALVYSDFPNSDAGYNADSTFYLDLLKAVKKGGFINHKIYGYCEVLSLEFKTMEVFKVRHKGVIYTARVVKDGRVMKIPLNDIAIEKL